MSHRTLVLRICALGVMSGVLVAPLQAQPATEPPRDGEGLSEFHAFRSGFTAALEFRADAGDRSRAVEAGQPIAGGGLAGGFLHAVTYALTVAPAECTTSESACGLRLPVYVAAGAIAGAVAASFFGRSRA